MGKWTATFFGFVLIAFCSFARVNGIAEADALDRERRPPAVGSKAAGRTVVLLSPGEDEDIQPSLQAAVDSASSGDTILLPQGEFYLDGRIIVDKFVSIVGRGSQEGGTKLYRREAVSDEELAAWKRMFEFQCYSDEPSHIIIADIYFKGQAPSLAEGDGGSIAKDYAVSMMKCVDFVITRNKFEHFGHGGVSVYHSDSLARGLIVDNVFRQNVKWDPSKGSFSLGYGVIIGGQDEAWVTDPQFGTDNFIFIEDNLFEKHRHAIAGAGTARYVVRRNQIVNHMVNHAVDAHGGGEHDNTLSARAYEIYDNEIFNTQFKDGSPLTDPPSVNSCSDLSYIAMRFRGGEGVVFGNTIRGFRYGIGVLTEITGAYPVLTQIGYLSGMNLGPTHSGIEPGQAAGDLFIWGNTFVPYDDNTCHSGFRNYAETLLKEGRDYHLEVPRPGYAAYTYPHPLRYLIPAPAQTFADVPYEHPYHDVIEGLYRAGYTAGCNTDPLMYCPEATMNRAESAVFVEHGIHDASTLPPQPTVQTFADLPLDSWAAKWAEALWQDHYTAGCGTDPLVYCPWQGHSRAEGCVFFLHMLNGPTYQPTQPSQQTFADVPLEAWYAKWVQAAYDAGLLTACQTSPELRFCPNDPLTRALAAYMMVHAKGLDAP